MFLWRNMANYPCYPFLSVALAYGKLRRLIRIRKKSENFKVEDKRQPRTFGLIKEKLNDYLLILDY